MANVNKVILIGRLTRDPELRYIPSGAAVCDLGLAVNREWTKKDSNEKEKETCFVDIVVWARRAEVVAEYFSKGDEIYIEGRLQLDTWQTKEGEKRSKLKVVMDTFEFIGGKKDAPATDTGKEPAQQAGAGSEEHAAALGADTGDDDAIPF